MKARVEYYGRAYDKVSYTSTVTLVTPVKRVDVQLAWEEAMTTIQSEHPTIALDMYERIYTGFGRDTIAVQVSGTVTECSACGSEGHSASVCPNV